MDLRWIHTAAEMLQSFEIESKPLLWTVMGEVDLLLRACRSGTTADNKILRRTISLRAAEDVDDLRGLSNLCIRRTLESFQETDSGEAFLFQQSCFRELHHVEREEQPRVAAGLAKMGCWQQFVGRKQMVPGTRKVESTISRELRAVKASWMSKWRRKENSRVP